MDREAPHFEYSEDNSPTDASLSVARMRQDLGDAVSDIQEEIIRLEARIASMPEARLLVDDLINSNESMDSIVDRALISAEELSDLSAKYAEEAEAQDATRQLLTDRMADFERKFAEFEIEADKRINEVTLEIPIRYWEQKQRSHHRSKTIWTLAFSVLSSVFIALLMWVIWSADHPTENTIGTQLFGDFNPWRLGSGALIATIVLIAVRLVGRIMMSHYHLESEAAERVVIAKAYLAFDALDTVLSAEERAELARINALPEDQKQARMTQFQEDKRNQIGKRRLSSTQRDAMLQALFRPSATGLVKEDAVPPSVLDLASRVAQHGKSSGN